MIVRLAVRLVARGSLTSFARLRIGSSGDVEKNRHDVAALPRTATVDPEEAPRSCIDVHETAVRVHPDSHESDRSSEARDFGVRNSGDHEIEGAPLTVIGSTAGYSERRKHSHRAGFKVLLEPVSKIEQSRIDGALFVVALITEHVRGAGQVLLVEPAVVAPRHQGETVARVQHLKDERRPRSHGRVRW